MRNAARFEGQGFSQIKRGLKRKSGGSGKKGDGLACGRVISPKKKRVGRRAPVAKGGKNWDFVNVRRGNVFGGNLRGNAWTQTKKRL